MEYEWSTEELPHAWPQIALLVGMGLLATAVPLLWSGEKPWGPYEAAAIDAMVVKARHSGVDPPHHEAAYTFEIGERLYTGRYSCDNACPIDHAREGRGLRVEYLLADPARNRPVGALTPGRYRWWRVMAVMGAALVLAGLVGRARGVGKDEGG